MKSSHHPSHVDSGRITPCLGFELRLGRKALKLIDRLLETGSIQDQAIRQTCEELRAAQASLRSGSPAQQS